MNICIRVNLPRLVWMGWTMTYVNSLRGERAPSDLLNMMANVTHNLIYRKIPNVTLRKRNDLIQLSITSRQSTYDYMCNGHNHRPALPNICKYTYHD